MALTFTSGAISVAFGTASFFMADDDKTVRVDVAQRLLSCIEDPPLATRSDYRDRLARYRREFARLAALKYSRGLYDPEVNVLVVRITANDLIHTAASSPAE